MTLDSKRKHPFLAVRDLGSGWAEVSLSEAKFKAQLCSALSSKSFNSAVSHAVFRVLTASSSDKLGGIFLGVVQDGCARVLATAFGERNAGVGWGRGMAYVRWVQGARSRGRDKRYPFYPQTQFVNVEQVQDLYQYSERDVEELLARWGLRSLIATFRRMGIDGRKLYNLSDLDLLDMHVNDPQERRSILSNIHTYFIRNHGFDVGDVVKLVLDVPNNMLSFLKHHEGKWKLLGSCKLPRTEGISASAPWRFGVSVYCPEDVVQVYVGDGNGENNQLISPPLLSLAANRDVDVGPSNTQGGKKDKQLDVHWRYLMAVGEAGAALGKRILILFLSDRSMFLEIVTADQGGLLFQTRCHTSDLELDPTSTAHVQRVNNEGSFNASTWHLPAVIERLSNDAAGSMRTLRLFGKGEGVEWSELGSRKSKRSTGPACQSSLQGWSFSAEEAAGEAEKPSTVVVKNHRDLTVYLLPDGFLVLGSRKAVRARGQLARVVDLEEAELEVARL